MSENQDKKRGMPYSLVIPYLIAIIIIAILLYFVSSALNLTESLSSVSELLGFPHLAEIIVPTIFLVIALSILVCLLWRMLKKTIPERESLEYNLDQTSTKLSFLNGIINQDVLNELTELSNDLERNTQKPDMAKVKDVINRIHRQIKFIKEYQDIGASDPEWQNVADTVMRARVGVNLGMVTVDIDMKNEEIYADRLLEKAFYYMIDNSLKHGSAKLTRIRLSSRTLDNKLIIVCEDDGIGIPVDQKSAIFPDTYGKHIGYGLFFVKEILAITGLIIKETGIPGKGARFEIIVPFGLHR